MKLSELAGHCSGDVKVIRDADIDCLYLLGKPKNNAGRCVSYMLQMKYLPALLENHVDAVICSAAIEDEIEDSFDGGICLSKDPRATFFEFHHILLEHAGSETETLIAPSAKIHETAVVAPCNVTIGENTVIGANCVIKEGVETGADCMIGDGCVLGTPAFYYYGEDDDKRLVESAGRLILESNVTIHSNTSVEKGVLLGGATVIGKNTSIDNLCLIGHDSIIGEGCTLAAGTILAGGVRMGDHCSTGVFTGFAPNVSVGNNVQLSIGAVVTKDIPDNSRYSGNFAVPHERFIKFIKELSRGGYRLSNSVSFAQASDRRCA